MKNKLLTILILLLFFGCKKEFSIPPKKTDLENRNLLGNVKECILYISHVRDDNGEIQKAKKIRKVTFTEFGAVKENESYDSEEKIKGFLVNYFDKNNTIIKGVDKHEPSTIVTTFESDSINKTETRSMVVNDRVKTDYVSKYGKHGKLEKFLIIKNGETKTRNYNYKFDSDNNVIFYEYETTYKGEKKSETYKYDSKGNRIEKVYSDGKYLKKEVSDFKEGKLYKVHVYKIDSDNKEVLISVKTYDEYNNNTKIETYKDSNLYRVAKNEFVFDINHNWIEQRHYNKYLNKNPKAYKLRTIQIREISYW